jgi:hypothetical protein
LVADGLVVVGAHGRSDGVGGYCVVSVVRSDWRMGALSVGTGLIEGPLFVGVASASDVFGESALTVPGTVGLPHVEPVVCGGVWARAEPVIAVEIIVASSSLMAFLLSPQSGIGCSTY